MVPDFYLFFIWLKGKARPAQCNYAKAYSALTEILEQSMGA